MEEKRFPTSAWFTGPKAENSEWFGDIIRRILEDHQYWRRNYFPEDGVVITSETQRQHGPWNDLFQDKLLELLAALKADFPFYSPRYAAHMVAEQTLPSIAGYFAGMLYNPNNITKESAPVTVELELQAGDMIAHMLGYDPAQSWSHLTGGRRLTVRRPCRLCRSVLRMPIFSAMPSVRQANHRHWKRSTGSTDRCTAG